MEDIFKKYLFEKHILVNDFDSEPENSFEVLFTFANKLNIKIVKGQELADLRLFKFAAEEIGINVPEPFYRGFPKSVRALSKEELLFDQLLHYTVTYGLGNFSEAGHSLFEETMEKIAFKESTKIKEFIIVNKEDGEKELERLMNNLLLSSRPISAIQYLLLRNYLTTTKMTIEKCNCKDTLVQLLIDTKDTRYCDLLNLNDIIKVVEQLNFKFYENMNIKFLNLKNQDRKFISACIDICVNKKFKLQDCFEKRAFWCGILHHIHYKPKTKLAINFVESMRYGKNCSAYSKFEKAISEGNIKLAVDILKNEKGVSVILRNLNYIVSRCKNDEDLEYLLKEIKTTNNILIIQNLIQYSNYKKGKQRVFKFTKFNRLKMHQETSKEFKNRQSFVSEENCQKISKMLNENLASNLKGKLGKVYIEDGMENIALPIQETTSMGGFGILPKGSLLKIEDAKKVRAFIYWEKVNDIDLSVIGLTENLKQREFSWRTMASKQSDAITFSGDETSGYNGGSEYFDIDINKFKKVHKDTRYLIFNANV
ncbi:MAG: hypothetical protein IJW82_05800, partial [Clostridia bacterium]|nr:hypothetical protein [Clostridia bacterium]